jgi:hypothetical protein
VYIRQVPGRFINWINGSEQHEYFDADPGAENAPKVDFSN